MSLPPEYFARAWQDDDDPWRIAGRWYERRKRDLVMAVLPQERFGRALEVGCAAGHLSERLAGRCDDLLACDVDGTAVALARTRLAGSPHGATVILEQRWLPAEYPEGGFDLVVVSEVGYYLGPEDLDLLAARVTASLRPGGVLLACHWRHPAPGYPGDAAQVHGRLGARGLAVVAHHVEPDLLLDVWTTGEASVAREEGWLP